MDAPVLTIRPARPSDELALRRLAALDSQRLPAGDLLVAEIDGECLAAIQVDGTAVIADPFRHTAGLVELLRERARQLEAAERARAVRPLRLATFVQPR